ncbi:MAG: hypothetical protein H7175_14130, partial [Burkholderiales bacterium]|nr:hypothetical protein [Anaerolineae bacterium]
MQRDIGNEVIVAIIAVAVLAFALTFGVILSLTSPPQGETTLTPIASVGQTDGSTMRSPQSETAVLPSIVSQMVGVAASATATPAHPTQTGTIVTFFPPVTVTVSNRVPSATPSVTPPLPATSTIAPSATKTATEAATIVAVAPTATLTLTPTRTESPTSAPSFTPTLTETV